MLCLQCSLHVAVCVTRVLWVLAVGQGRVLCHSRLCARASSALSPHVRGVASLALPAFLAEILRVAW